jgi:hypothetical protein
MSLTKVSYSMITGAVANILDYGAVADYNTTTGVGTNNAAAIQAAINSMSSSGGAVFIPAGKYRIDSSLTIPFGVSMFGEGGSVSTIYPRSCNGLNFNSASYDNGCMFYQDFGLQGAVGSTANWAAVESILPPGGVVSVDSRDGLNFSRLRIRDFNQGFIINNTWQCSFRDLQISKVNQAFNFGTYALNHNVCNNTIIFESGDSFSGTANEFGVIMDGTGCEGIHVIGNVIYGFNSDIVIGSAIFVNILDNDLEANVNGIRYATVSNIFNIKDNYIQVDDAGAGDACIYGLGLGSVIQSQVNIEGNVCIATGTVPAGIRINGAANTNQFHHRITGNHFTGITTNDIQLNSPGQCFVENNRCVSSAPTNSIYIGTVIEAPVYIGYNYFAKLLFVDITANYTGGLLILENNAESGVYLPRKQSAVPTTGTWRVTDVVMNSVPTSGQPAGWVCSVAGTPGTWLAMANLV